MKLSEAIRLGASSTLPAVGAYFEYDEEMGQLRTCAIASAAFAFGKEGFDIDEGGYDLRKFLTEHLDVSVDGFIEGPSGEVQSIFTTAIELNDATFRGELDPRIATAAWFEERGL